MTDIAAGTRRKIALYGWLERLLGRALLYKFGRFLYLGARRELMNEPHVNGEYALVRWVARLAAGGSGGSPPLMFLDVGANIGDWTREALATLKSSDRQSGGKVHAFEPAPAQRRTLIGRNGADQASGLLVVHDCAVGAEAGRVMFEVTGEASGTGAILAAPAGASAGLIEVEAQTLDELSRIHGFGDVTLVKVDTEGNDFNVIKGARGLLEQRRIGVLQFEYNWRWIDFGYSLKDVFNFARGLDYALGALTADRIELHDAWHPELDRFIETNYVLVRRNLVGGLPHQVMRYSEANVVEAVSAAVSVGS